jgi:antitoxin (DNA-binding transcriptional repressor) of toxin-antitoxin stability system
MKTVSKSHLKAHMLRLFREIERSGEELIVTDNNVPVLRVAPFQPQQDVDKTFAGLRGNVTYSRSIDDPTST